MQTTSLRLAENLSLLRKTKKLTQDEVAEFAGVSKAAVSKWENGLSYPDVQLLPRLASFFRVSVDELIGYAPQLDRQMISDIYHRLAADFANKPFDDVYRECRKLVRDYYHCGPFLLQMALLYMKHHMLAGTEKRKAEVLQEAAFLLRHIREAIVNPVFFVLEKQEKYQVLMKKYGGNANEV